MNVKEFIDYDSYYDDKEGTLYAWYDTEKLLNLLQAITTKLNITKEDV